MASFPRFALVVIVPIMLDGTSIPRAFGQGYSPQEAVARATVAEGLRVKLVASEPDVRDPIFVKCDVRGRLWTIQYLQYPNPAGLKRVKVDRWSRTIYDRVPEPPPRGPRGADRITILEDTDGDRRADRIHDFINGLNLATGLEFGHGGVFVLQVPYLLFYPDRNRDDVPDSDPEVLLTGFGMEDAQSFSNHLTFGPDGWLYGVNGSTTTCNIRGIEFQQGLWRYHPVTKEFELFCEGGSNCFGVTFDDKGELYYSTNGGPFVHAVQGGYFYKSFGKHGPVHNPYAYHYFPEVTRDEVPGGPPTGGTVYRGTSFPAHFRGKFIAGNFLGHTASWWTIEPLGTTVRAKLGATLFDSHDRWCGPTDMCLAPDGAMYLSDFYDQRTAHPDPDANWDHSNGRIYRIEAADGKPHRHVDVVGLSSEELVDLLTGDNGWYADRARIELARRRDSSVVPRLRAMALNTDNGCHALEGLWALHVSAGVDDATACRLLEHPDEYVRLWTVRLVGDERRVSEAVHKALLARAERDRSPRVRLQLACSAKRLPGPQGLPIIERLLARNLDLEDERITWSLWWAIENKTTSDAPRLLDMFARQAAWTNPMQRDLTLLLVRRYAAEGTKTGYDACLRLIQATPTEYQTLVFERLNVGLAERSQSLPDVGQGGLFENQASLSDPAPQATSRVFEPLSEQLRTYIAQLWTKHPDAPVPLELALRAEINAAHNRLTVMATAEKSDREDRINALRLLQEFARTDDVDAMLELVSIQQPTEVILGALNVLARFDNPRLPDALLRNYGQMAPEVQSKVRELLFSRSASAKSFLDRVERGEIASQSVPVDQLRRIGLLNDVDLDAIVRKHWGNIGPGTAEEKLATMRRFNNDLRFAAGDATRGKSLFGKHCGVCHTLHSEGNKVGPDLTTANRKDRAALLANVVDPSAVVRREYISYVLETTSGQVLTGLLAEQDAASVTILDAKNQRLKVPRNEVEQLVESSASLMPEKILESLTPQELRDLFAYLEQ